ncbi:MAG: apolipoprotein N-acyltransferase [Streptosporangiaceae bacterium]
MTQVMAPADTAPSPRASRPWFRYAAAAAAGLIMFLAFPPSILGPSAGSVDGLWPMALTPLGVAVLTLAVRGVRARTAALLGLVCGIVFFVPVLPGLKPIGTDVWIGLSVTETLYFAPMAACMAVVSRTRLWPLWTAALWVAQEALRGRAPLGGFPWARLAFSQTDTMLTSYAQLGGVPLVSFVTAMMGTLLAYAILHHSRAGTAAALLGAFALPVAGALLPVHGTGGDKLTVAVIQGNVPRSGLDFLGQRQAVLNNHVARTRELAAQIRAGQVARPDLVIWPENSSDLDPYHDPDARTVIDGAVKDVGVPVLVGAVVDTPDGEKVENRGIVWDPVTGPGAYYVKRHPVPFGEYIPFRSLATKLVSRLDRIPRDFAAGTRSNVLKLGPVDIGDVICFEVAYDGIVRDAAAGRLLIVQTNNATYGHTSLPWQQLAMSRMRAVEHDRTVLVAATSGISAIIDPDGRVVEQSREFTPDIQVASVPVRASRTISDHLGAIPEWALTLLGLTAVLAALRARRKERS